MEERNEWMDTGQHYEVSNLDGCLQRIIGDLCDKADERWRRYDCPA